MKDVSNTANFGEQVLTGQEPRGTEYAAPSLMNVERFGMSKVEMTTYTVRPGVNIMKKSSIFDQRQNLDTDEKTSRRNLPE